MNPTLVIKTGTSSIPGATVKGDFSYFSASTLNLGPTNTTGFYSGIDAPLGGYTVYQSGGPSGLNIRVATTNTELNSILTGAGATGSTLNQRINWATNTNSVFINSGTTTSYYLAGQFTSVNDIPTPFLTSLNTDGSPNNSFNVGSGFNNGVSSINFQSNGKILAGGQFTTYQGLTQNRLIRLKSDGTKDTSFDIGTGFNQEVTSIAIQSDGKILVGGYFTTFTGTSQNYLIRLNSDGSKDTSFDIGTGFNSFVLSITIQSDGKILVGGGFNTYQDSTQNRLIRLNTDGTKDTSFDIGTGFGGGVSSIEIQSDGKILVGGGFSTYQDSTQNRLIRLNTDGTKDTSFDIGTGFSGITPTVWSLEIQSDGKILVGGAFTSFSGETQNKIIRLNSNGSKDTSFNSSFSVTNSTFVFYDIKIQSNGKILCGGGFTGRGSILNENNLVRFNSDGSTDTLNIGVGFNENVQSIAFNSEGKIFLGGLFTLFSGSSQNRIIKTLNYSLDPTFDIGTGFNGEINSIKFQSDGKILAGGVFTSYQGFTGNTYLMRLNTDGSRDTSFNVGNAFNGTIESIAVQSDGKILAGGLFTTSTGTTPTRLARVNSNGSIDTSFQTGAGFTGGNVLTVALQSDEKILVGGVFTTFSGSSRNKIARLNSNGSLDTSLPSGFQSTSTVNVSAIAIQSDGKILLGGAYTFYSGLTQNRFIRINSNGSKDTTFDIGTGFNSGVSSIAIQSDGKILVGGSFSTYQGSTQNRLIRLNTDGTKDTSFDIGTGFNSIVYSIAIQSDGKILCGGLFTTYQGLPAYYTILLNSNGSISNDTLILNLQVNSVLIQ